MSRQMRGTVKMRGSRPMHSGEMAARDEVSALKARRNKKNFTAAQTQGKVTGRWTEEEHERFNEGKSIQIFPDIYQN